MSPLYHKNSITASSAENKITPEYARNVTLRLLDLKKGATQNFLEAGKLFKEIHDNKLWELEGAHSFNSYIAEIGYDRDSAYKMMLVYDTFGKSVDSNLQLLEAGWVKLAKVAPHVNENNYEVMLDLAENNSLSDINEELIRQRYIVKKETDSEFVECPFCHKSFVPIKRQDKTFKQEDYNRVLDTYKKIKEIEIHGKEYEPLQQSIKTMFMNGRTPDEIIKSIEWLGDNAEYEWTMNTLKTKIPEILSKIGYKKVEISEFEKRWRQS